MSQVLDSKSLRWELKHYLASAKTLGLYLCSFPVAFALTQELGRFPLCGELFWTLAFFTPLIFEESCVWYLKLLLIGLGFLILCLFIPFSKTLTVMLFFILVGWSGAIRVSVKRLGGSTNSNHRRFIYWIFSAVLTGVMVLYSMEVIFEFFSATNLVAIALASLVGAVIMSGQEFLLLLLSRFIYAQAFNPAEFGSVYKDLASRQSRLTARIVSSLNNQPEIYEIAFRIIDQNQFLMSHGNELFEHLRQKKIRFDAEGNPLIPVGSRTAYESSAQKDNEFLVWRERIKSIVNEERRIHDTVEANLLKLENLESFLMTQKSENLHSKQSEIESLSRPAFERLELDEERMKVLKELEDSGFKD